MLGRALPLLLLALLCVTQVAWAQATTSGPTQAPKLDDSPPAPAAKPEPAPALPDLAPVTPPTPIEQRVNVDFRISGLGEPELTNAYNWLGYVAEDQRRGLDLARLHSLHDAAEKSIAKALQPYGFYAPKISKQLTGGPRAYRADYQVQAGEPVLWTASRIELAGEAKDQLTEAVSKLAPRVGRRLRHSDYETTKLLLAQQVREAGYLDARFTTSELQVDPATHTAVAVLVMDSGPLWRFGEVRYSGDTDKVKPALLDRYVRIKPGEPFSPQKLLDSQFALTDLDYYTNIELTPLREQADGDRIPVDIKLTAAKSRRDNYGVGYGTDTGARVSADTEFRRLNNKGQKLNAGVRVSEKQYGSNLEWRLPRGKVPNEFLSFTAALTQERMAYGDTRRYEVGASLNRTVHGWLHRRYIRYQRSLFKLDQGEDRTVSVLTPGISISRQWLDDPAYARRAFSIFADTHGAQQGVLSDASFVQIRSLIKAALPLWKKDRLLARAEFGATAVRGFTALPPDERFFTGGDQTVRGYAYQAIGAGRDDNGGVIGGRYLNVFSVELEKSLRGAIGGALFVDAGGVGDSPNPKLHMGAGAGLRYRAPFGSVQVDLAHPFDVGQPPVRLHLGLRVGF